MSPNPRLKEQQTIIYHGEEGTKREAEKIMNMSKTN